MGHQEVIRFACGISDDKKSIFEFAFNTLLSTFVRFERDDKEFFGLLCGEVFAVNNIDPVHNRYICLIDDDFDLSKFAPSRLYLFENFEASTASRFQFAMPDACNLSAECTIEVDGNEEMFETLKVVKEMTRFQQLTVRYLRLEYIDAKSKESEADDSSSSSDDYSRSSDDENPFQNLARKAKKPFKNTFKMLKQTVKNKKTNDMGKLILNVLEISKNIRFVEINDCKLSSPVYNHISKQLCECDKLKELDLSETRYIPNKLGRAIASMKSLEVVNLSDCRMTPSVSRAILTGFSHCKYLKEICLDDNQLTNCLGHMFTHYAEFHFLENLTISNTKITQSDFKNLLISLSNRKLPKLEWFECEGNNDHSTPYSDSLTLLIDVMHYPESEAVFNELGIFGFEDPEFHILVRGYLDESCPSRGDVQVILATAEESKLLQLEVLDLKGHNNDSSLNFLQKSIIGREEILGLSEIIASDKLPQLTSLNLSHNKLTDLMEVLMRASYPQLQRLYIEDARLSKLDVNSLAHAVNLNHLPKLKRLDLRGSKPGGAEREWQRLVESLLTVHTEYKLELFLADTNISLARWETLESLCRETNIELYKY